MDRFYIVVTGLPASGKTTIGRKLAGTLDIQFIDKDEYLEQLYLERGIGNIDWRKSLSRESDTSFVRTAKDSNCAVLVSHWKTIVSEERSGTPVDWLRESDSSIIELFCSCPVQVAASRFAARHRHPGHLDSYRTDADVLNWMSHYQKGLPLGLGELITVDASDQLDFDELQVQISDILDVST